MQDLVVTYLVHIASPPLHKLRQDVVGPKSVGFSLPSLTGSCVLCPYCLGRSSSPAGPFGFQDQARTVCHRRPSLQRYLKCILSRRRPSLTGRCVPSPYRSRPFGFQDQARAVCHCRSPQRYLKCILSRHRSSLTGSCVPCPHRLG
jgi:hypothetical protein